VVLREVARSVYGVILEDGMSAVDVAATEQYRRSLRAARSARKAAE